MRKIVSAMLTALIVFPSGIHAQEQGPLKTRNLSSVTAFATNTASHDTSVSEKGATVRRVVAALGVGRKIDLKTGSLKVRATIASIEPGGFTIVHGSKLTRDRIAYDNVQQIKPAGNRGMSPKAAIIAIAVIATIAVITWVATLGNS